jgi:hypothetical protein
MNHGGEIRVLFCGLLLSAAPLGATQAHGGSPQKAKADSASPSTKEATDACKLLNNEEIEAVQGEPVKETKVSAQPSGGMLMSQCVFHTATFAKSVNVALATPNGAGNSGVGPRKFWQRQFHFAEIGAKETRAAGRVPEPELEEEGSRARPIQGLGEEAYWVGNAVAGALYVLQGDVFLRISVGGVREESARIEKSEALARAAMKRL